MGKPKAQNRELTLSTKGKEKDLIIGFHLLKMDRAQRFHPSTFEAYSPPLEDSTFDILRFAFLYVPSFDILRFFFSMYCNHRDIIKLGGITDMIEYI